MNNNLILLLFGLIVLYLLSQTVSKPVIIEKRTEGMTNQSINDIMHGSAFMIKSNRYLVKDGAKPQKSVYSCTVGPVGNPQCSPYKPYCGDPHPGTKPCSYHINQESPAWATPYEPGANNTYGDLVWHTMSPRMVLQDNCMRCNEFAPGTNHRVPEGVATSTFAEHSESVGNYGMIYDNIVDPKTIGINQHSMSNTPGNGIAPMQPSCAYIKSLQHEQL